MLTKLAAIALCLLFSLGATPAGAQVFDGFTAMTFPRSDVPIGARWIPGVGPDGSATTGDNISITTGLTGAAMNGQLKASITGSLASYLGLSANVLRTQSVTYSNLSLHRVADLSRNGNVGAGEQMLQQVIKAGQIIVRTSTSGAAQIRASAAARGLPASISSDGAGGSQVALDGSNLFVAYQVVEFRQGQVRERTIRFDGREDVVFENTWRVRVCCATRERATLEIRNLRSAASDGSLAAERFQYDYDTNRDAEYALRTIREGDSIVANLLRVRLRPEFTCGVTDPNGREVCMGPWWPRENNDMRLTTTRMRIVNVARPSGAF